MPVNVLPSTPEPRAGSSPHPPSRATLAYLHLGSLPLIIRPGPPGSGYVTVIGQLGTPYARLHLSISPDIDLQALSAELPVHLSAPEPWRLPLPETHNIEYVAGYQQARRTCLPTAGLFVPAATVNPAALPCRYDQGPARAAFEAGAARYQQYVLTCLQRHAERTVHTHDHPAGLSRTG
jgi:hypothetical protein